MQKKNKKRWHRFSTVQILALGFLSLILVGSILLTFPFASADGTWTPYIDAVFTATSAVCVTGLTTVNTLAHWSTAGHVVIMVLIESGGLGFMAFPVLVYFVLGKKIQFSTRMLLKDALNLDDVSGAVGLMKYILRLAVIIQGVGAVLLSFQFIPDFGWGKGIFYSIFHSISAFCNAGFDLLGESLVPYQTKPYIMYILSFLIIAGGFGFIVWRDVLNYHQTKKLSIHTKLALSVTGILLVGGFLLFFFTGAASKLAPNLSFWDNVANTWFTTVTPRTAGFYSVNYGDMNHAGIILTIVLMFIGGTSGSTAGGLKTTTIGVLFIQIKSLFSGRTNAEFQGRTIKSSVVFRAFLFFFLSLTLVIVATTILTITETIPNGFGIEYIAFEVVSAFATVGLTMGITPELTIGGKILIMLLMYLGRVGIFTVGFSIMKKAQAQEAHYKFPEESVLIG
ncbi:TrkH family potassium uptake protein [Enterococcus timonensis]|uniref:TrkH family potassium uptake protein n=1 Tax=Enterococcus timonensis TaxID=1852364 RepID=UPI0008DA1ED0|nr:TrkH family potassium uptake protein [Enterococcus timonensis]